MNNQELPDSVILVIDDSSGNLRVLLSFLTKAGFKVLTKKDGKSALALVARKKPDLILLDIVMPGIDDLRSVAN